MSVSDQARFSTPRDKGACPQRASKPHQNTPTTPVLDSPNAPTSDP